MTHFALRVVLVTVSTAGALAAAEMALRIHRGEGRMIYDGRLGWVPRPGHVDIGWRSDVDERGFRRGGPAIPEAGRPILAVGDSFTFGDEVEDHETWPAQLQVLLRRPVLNAGVGAYGIDQAYLRAEGLVPQYNPSAVILSFISDDINRTELAYYRYGRGWKPYFEHDSAGALVLRNVPVPREPLPGVLDGWPALRRLLGRSVLADALLDRVVEPGDGRVHRHGEAVSAALFQKLDQLCRRWQSRLIVVALATNGHIGGNERLSRVVARAREGGIEVLDLATAMQRFDAGQFQQMFRADGHYAPSLNRWVAEQLATTLR